MTLTQPDFMQLQDELRGFTTRKGAVMWRTPLTSGRSFLEAFAT